MKTIQIVFAVIGGIVALGMLLNYLVNKKRSEQYYANQMIYLRSFIHRKPVTQENFEFLVSKFDELARYKTDDRFRKKLFVDFSQKYKTFWEAMI